MVDSNPTVGELFKSKAVNDEQVNAAVEAYCDNPTTASFASSSRALKRDAIRTAILLARAQKA
ncbi:hypothetical protein [Methylorubrum populi]|uniref:Uncharacterized protein n=1 Tax=Methylorubrum populi TaxID=223967 RepID=A0A833MVQ9_9HYPH|nr:hypothetical protein [Methylorubrum populi]KAB7783507.1 hypothetical protein F8B43_4069 [Methylorubrum populi]